MSQLPGWIRNALIVIGVLALIPPALILRARYATSREPRIHIIPDMDNQKKFKAQSTHPLYADQRSMRPPVPGTVARGRQRATDPHYHEGRVGDAWATTFPERVTVDADFLARGKERYGVFCAPCHGYDGYGNGMVHVRASGVSAATWTPPLSLHQGGEDSPRSRELGHLYNTITNGIRNMSGYGGQIPVEDRWAIVAYIKALQFSQDAQ